MTVYHICFFSFWENTVLKSPAHVGQGTQALQSQHATAQLCWAVYVLLWRQPEYSSYSSHPSAITKNSNIFPQAEHYSQQQSQPHPSQAVWRC